MLEPEALRRWERMTAAMIRTAGDDDPEGFAQVVRVLDDARALLPEAARVLREGTTGPVHHGGNGYSWHDLACALGISRQAAAQRFGRVS